MADPILSSDLESRLQGCGFTVVERSVDGPMGSARYLLTDQTIDISVFDDRGEQGVGLGVSSGTTYAIQVWRQVLGEASPGPLGIHDQLGWVMDNLCNIRRMVESDGAMDRRLREANWSIIKERLGLNPDANQDDPRTWHRA